MNFLAMNMNKFIAVLLIFEVHSFTKDLEISLAQVNIYYQRPLRRGTFNEQPILEVENLDHKKDFKVVIHGYLGNRGHSAVIPLRNAYLSQGTANILMADWEKAAAFDYPTSRVLIVKVAMKFEELLSEFMKKHDIDPDEIHLIGHSLGAHVVGNIGRNFNGTFGRITGLDPALPLFKPQSFDGLRPEDAKFVDVIHTDYPIFGEITPRGKLDFYPNYGKAPQPGCKEADLKTLTSCSHFRSVQLYAESINIPRNFPAISCALSEILSDNAGSCRRTGNLNTTVFMGEYVDRNAIGEYFLLTSAVPPFGQGENSEIYRNVNLEHEP